jgi:predicted metal-dependent TIM-barrel fold hydrolase
MLFSEYDIKQMEILKARKPIERFLIMTDLIYGQINIMKAGIRFQNPGFNNKEIEKCLKEKIRQIYSLKL